MYFSKKRTHLLSGRVLDMKFGTDVKIHKHKHTKSGKREREKIRKQCHTARAMYTVTARWVGPWETQT